MYSSWKVANPAEDPQEILLVAAEAAGMGPAAVENHIQESVSSCVDMGDASVLYDVLSFGYHLVNGRLRCVGESGNAVQIRF